MLNNTPTPQFSPRAYDYDMVMNRSHFYFANETIICPQKSMGSSCCGKGRFDITLFYDDP